MCKYCYNCGKQLPKNAIFCSECGKPQVEKLTTEQQNNNETSNLILENYNGFEKERLINGLEQDIEYFQKKQSTYDSIDNLNLLKTQIKEPDGWGWFWFGVVLFLIAFFFMNYKFPKLDEFYLSIACFIVCVICFPIVMYNQEKESNEDKRLSIDGGLEGDEEELKTYFNEYKNSTVSFEYSNPRVIEMLKHNISSGRADSIKEAINCMLDDSHKQQILINQDKIVENSKVAASAAQRTAIYSLGTFINTRK